MTEKKLKTVRPRLEVLVAQDRDLLKALVKGRWTRSCRRRRRSSWAQRLGSATGRESVTGRGITSGAW